MTASPAPAPKVHDARNATSVRHGASYYWRLWLPDIAVLLVLMAVPQWFFHDGTCDIACMRPLFTPGSGAGWTQHLAFFWACIKDELAPVPAVVECVVSVWE